MEQKNFQSPEDFILDDQFCAWIQSSKTKFDAHWQAWIAQHPESLFMMQEAESLIQSFKYQDQKKIGDLTIRQEWAKVTLQIEQTPQTSSQKTFKKVYGIAAAVVFLLVLSFLIALFNNPEKTFNTPYGEIQTIILSDGSKVVLQANSNIRFNKKWKKDQLREVWLEGEAYFEVASTHSTGRKAFIVYAGEMNIEVLGTQFNVINRLVRKQVVLEEGKINLMINNPNLPIYIDSLSGDNRSLNSIVLTPGELVALEKQQQHFTRKNVNTKLYTSWIQEKWRFQDTPIADVVQLIEDNFGLISIFEEETLKEKSITGTVPSNDLNTLLKGLEQLFDVEIEQSGSQIIFNNQSG